MKNSVYFLMMIALLIGCKGEEDDTQSNENLTEEADERPFEIVELDEAPAPELYQEFHPNGALKIEGKLNADGEREGLWMSWYDNGIKWSESYYTNGLRDGHSLTFYPNGKVRYVGEYKLDERIGTWKFYDEAGELTKEENF